MTTHGHKSLSFRILVVDDNRDAADSLAMLLALSGSETRSAFGGVQALSVGAVFRPDVVILDLRMPNMNGWQLARQIRHQLWGNSIMLVALTGWTDPRLQEQSTRAGIDAHLLKPANCEDLLELLSSFRYANDEEALRSGAGRYLN